MWNTVYRAAWPVVALFLLWGAFSGVMYWSHTGGNSQCVLPLVKHGGSITTRGISMRCLATRQAQVNAHGQTGDAYHHEGAQASQLMIDETYKQLQIADRAFRALGIKYTIARGTLLAALRNGGLIPNDDDLDTSVEEGFDEKALQEKLGEMGAKLLRHDVVGYQIALKDASDETHPLDVWSLRRNANGKMDFSGFSARQRWPRSYVKVSAWDAEFSEVQFGHLTLMMMPVEEACQALLRNYGASVFTEAYKITNHITHAQALFTYGSLLDKDPKCGDFYYIASSEDPRGTEDASCECLPDGKRVWRRVLTINIEQLVGLACLALIALYVLVSIYKYCIRNSRRRTYW